METGHDLNHLLHQARSRWLNPGEVLFIIQNHHSGMISQSVSQQPTSGSLFLYNKNNHPSFRRDGHNWRKKPNRNCANESHERLKVDNVEALNCYYAKGEASDHFRRRSYWMLDGTKKHIVLVHYRDITEGTTNSASISLGQSSTFTQSVNNLALENQGTASLSDMHMHGSTQSLCSPHSVEVHSRVVAEQQQIEQFDNSTAAGNASISLEVEMLFQELVEQLGRNCDIGKESIPFDYENQDIDGTAVLGCDNSLRELNQGFTLQQGRDDCTISGLTDPSTWQDIASMSACLMMNPRGTNIPDCYSMLPHPVQVQMPLPGEHSNLTIIPEHKFEIKAISPEWGFANEFTKVIIIGSFHCDASEFCWARFGDIEVPVHIMQDGVILCQAPPNRAGKVTFCITTGNREFWSEVKDFEYRDRNSACNNCTRVQQGENKSMEEVQLLVNFVQMLLSDSSLQKGEGNKFNIHPSRTQKGYEESMDNIIEDLLRGCSTSSDTIDWVLWELLKDKLKQWLLARSLDGDSNLSCTLSRKEQGIIHIVAGLGYEWALDSILGSGVGVNFRDTHGWTALHWAARFGRENMVAALVASGASVGAVTDPSTQYRMSKDPAFIADAYGHKGIAGYLSELALTTHVASLKIDEAHSMQDEAEDNVSNISKEFGVSVEDQRCIKRVLVATRNVVRAAGLIQEAFRVHSFKKRQQRDAAKRSKVDKYGFTADGIQDLSAAALAIQKYYRGWKRRSHFLKMRKKAVKIQAHVRGYQVRKYFRVVWAVGILDMIVLRWRRGRAGLRGFRSVDENEEDEDILRAIRRQIVDTTLPEAVERVRSMIHSPEAREQYIRMLETFRQANARIVSGLTNDEELASLIVAFSTEQDNADAFQLPF